MRIDVITLFPQVFEPLNASIIKRARDSGLLHIHFHNLRDFTHDRHRTVDDAPFGGGSGMVLKPEPVFEAVDFVRGLEAERGTVILLTPQGSIFRQETALDLSRSNRLILICGHYEGFDERIRLGLADMELSIGDYVLTGGELPAMVIIEAVARLVPGVIDRESALMESFSGGLLDFPQYTRPQEYRGMAVPEVLLSGNHAEIAGWRRRESIHRTFLRRPDLLDTAALSDEERRLLSSREWPGNT
jgi:tRNA (guanine37-N1)-methyltransferase